MSDDLPPTLIALALMIPFVAIVVGLWAARRPLQPYVDPGPPTDDAPSPDGMGPIIKLKSHKGLDYGSGGGGDSGGGDGGGGGGGGD